MSSLNSRSTFIALAISMAMVTPMAAQAAPSPAQKCEATVERASGRLTRCYMGAYAHQTLTGKDITGNLERCERRFRTRYDRAFLRYGMGCPVLEPSGNFEVYLSQCAREVREVASGTSAFRAAASNAKKCEASIERASGNYGRCTMSTLARFTLHGRDISMGLDRCDARLQKHYDRAFAKYGAACASFETLDNYKSHINQCANDAAAAAAGSALGTLAVDAGSDRSAAEGQTVSLHALGYGIVGGSPTYSWTQVSPATPMLTLTGAATDNPTFVVPAVGLSTSFVLEVTLTDGTRVTTDDMTVSVAPGQAAHPNAPLTIAGAQPQAPLLVVAQSAAEVPAGTSQVLTALASGGDQHYSWVWKYKGQAGGPSPDPTLGSLNGPLLDVTLPAVTAPTTYAFEVEVTDGGGAFAKDSTTLFVSPSPGLQPLALYAPPISVEEGPLAAYMAASAVGGTGPYIYSWTQTVGPTVTLSYPATPDLSLAGFQPPAVDADTVLTFEVTVTDSLGAVAVRNVNALVQNVFANTPPQLLLLQAPPAAQAVGGTSLHLSANARGGTPPYTWLWEQTAGTAATLSGETTDTLTLTPAAGPDETITLKVTVTDSEGVPVSLDDTVDVHVLASPSAAPLSIPAIPKIYLDEGTANVGISAVAQGGTGSYSYSWQFVASGGLTTLALTDANTDVVRFDAPQVFAMATLQLRVTVDDGMNTASADAWVVVNDITPALSLMLQSHDTITAKNPQTVALGVGLVVRGGEGSPTFAWTQTAGPAVTLTGAATAGPTFTAPAVTTQTVLSFQVVVTDAAGRTQQVTQTVTVVPSAPPLRGALGYGASEAFTGQEVIMTFSFQEFGTPPYRYIYTQTSGPKFNVNPDRTNVLIIPSISAPTMVTFRVDVFDSAMPPQTDHSEPSFRIRPAFTHRGSTCLVCGDPNTMTPCNDFELVLADPTECPESKPYCMNEIIQHGLQVDQYRYCEGELLTYKNWYSATSDEPICLKFDPNSPETALTCYLGCWGDMCNIEANPPDNLLYRP